MADTVQTAIYELGLKVADYMAAATQVENANQRLVKSADGVAVTEEKVDRATRTTAEGFTRLEARYVPLLALERQRVAEMDRATRYLKEGTVSHDRWAAQIQRVNAHYDQQVAKMREADRAAASSRQGLISLGGAYSSLAGFVGAFGVSLGLAGLVQFGRHVIDTVGGLGELAEQVGVTTQALQVLQYTAAQTGVKEEQLEKSLAKFSQTIGEAGGHSAEAIRKFQALGIGIQDMAGRTRPTHDILQDVAVALFSLPDPTQRAAAAAELFGKSGYRLLPLLAELRAGYANLSDDAKRLGYVHSDELIKRFDDLGDAMVRNSKRFIGWAATIGDTAFQNASDNIKKIEAAIERISGSKNNRITQDWLLAIPGLGDPTDRTGSSSGLEIAKNTKNPVSEAELRRNQAAIEYIRTLELQRDSVGRTEAEIARMRLTREVETEIVKGQIVQHRKFTDAQVAEAVALIEARNRREDQIRLLRVYGEIAARAAVEEYELANRLSESNNKRVLWLQDQRQAAAALEEDIALTARATVEYDDLTNSYRLNTRELDVARKARELLAQAQQAGIAMSREEAQAMAEGQVDAGERLRKTQGAIEKTARAANENMAEIERFADRAFDRIGSSITQMFVEGKGAAVSFRNTMMGVVSELYQEFIKLAMINPLKNALFGGTAPTLGGVFGTLFDGMGSGASASAAEWGPFPYARGGAFGAGGAVIPFARGGLVNSPTLFEFAQGTGLVGEAGPEAIMPLARLPNGNLGIHALGGGGGVHLVINNLGEPMRAETGEDESGRLVVTLIPMMRQIGREEGEGAVKRYAQGTGMRKSLREYGVQPQAVSRG